MFKKNPFQSIFLTILYFLILIDRNLYTNISKLWSILYIIEIFLSIKTKFLYNFSWLLGEGGIYSEFSGIFSR